MLSKVFEWSRIANPTPDDDYVAKRKAVVQGLADELPKKIGLLVDCACAAAAGVVPRFAQESDIVETVVEASRVHDGISSFPVRGECQGTSVPA
jgi:phosphomannomutase